MTAKSNTINNLYSGEFFSGESEENLLQKLAYATDASVYQEMPHAVALPKNAEDIKLLIAYAHNNKTTLIPRAAGTSLAGQVVGSGVVVDISKYFNNILEVNPNQKWVRVQPGVIRNDLNVYLKPYGLMFGPETSTASRAMVGGMIGNNSCGLHSIVWGAVRDHLLEIKAFLSDGSQVVFKALTLPEFDAKCQLKSLEGQIYRSFKAILENKQNQEAISEGFPDAHITRRNTGYALDSLVQEYQNLLNGGTFNFCKLIAGSEGTLCFVTEATLNILPLPPKENALVNVHCHSLKESLLVNLIALEHHCYASELIDKLVVDLTENNAEQTRNRSFVEGSPVAILMVEFFEETQEKLSLKVQAFINHCKNEGLGYSFPVLLNQETSKAWELRKAALSILSNQKGDLVPTNLIEDCAVLPKDLPNYIDEIEALLQKYEIAYSISAHAGAGELHVMPMMNLRNQKGKDLFRTILEETAIIVKRYKGSLSGEHGDGRLRGEFIPLMMGEHNYRLFEEVKHIFDPNNVFNQGKITASPAMNASMRVHEEIKKPLINTLFNFTEEEGILKLAEKCIGSGDCRKTEVTGGTMCPSYMATRAETDSTRARANMLRHFYTENGPNSSPTQHATKQVLDLCLSCKACKTECPSSVDVTKMKAEFTQNYYDKNGIPLRARLVANFSKLMKLASYVPGVYEWFYSKKSLRVLANNLVGFHPERSMPHLSKELFSVWFQKIGSLQNPKTPISSIYIFADEFTEFNDSHIGIKLVQLLQKLNYEVLIPKHVESGRSSLSKGFVKNAKKIANKNITLLANLVSDNSPLIGIEPSAILSFRDEYPVLVDQNLQEKAAQIAQNSYLFEEWFAQEIEKGHINKTSFTQATKLIKLHGHCHQKALSSLVPSKKALSLPVNYQVQLIPSGCCGMAGSFGYEKEHYDISMKIGELVLFPAVRNFEKEIIIAAPGTSCRHQILDGTSKIALHPIEILFDALV